MTAASRARQRWWSREHLARSFSAIHSRYQEIPAPKDFTCSPILPALLDRAPQIEHERDVFFTYPALAALEKSTGSCIIGTIALDKALEHLYALPEVARSAGDTVVKEEHVKILFGKK